MLETFLVTVGGRFICRIRTTRRALFARFPYSIIVGNHCDVLPQE